MIDVIIALLIDLTTPLQDHGPGLQSLNLKKVALFAAGGGAYSLVAFLNSSSKRIEEFSPKKFSQPVILGVIAGIIVASQGQDLTPTNIDAAMALAIPMVNQLLNMRNSTSTPSDNSPSGSVDRGSESDREQTGRNRRRRQDP